MALMGKREFARFAGVTLARVQDGIRQGWIRPSAVVKTPEGITKIESEIALQDLQNHDSISNQKLGGLNPKIQTNKVVMEVIEGKEVPVEKLNFDDEFQQIRKAKLSVEEFRGRKLELEVLEKEGQLLNAEEVRKTISKLVTETKEAILNVPNKVGPELLACHDLVELEVKLTEALNQALENLSRLNIKYEFN